MSSLVNNILFVISSIFISFAQIFVWSRFYEQKINFKNIWFFIGLVILSILGLLNYYFMSAFVRMILNLIIFGLCNFLIFCREIKELIINTLYSEFLLTISDVIFSLFLMIFLKFSVDIIVYDKVVTYSGNFCISLIFMFFCRIKLVKTIYYKLIDLIYKIKTFYLLIICIFVIISMNFLMATVYYDLSSVYIILINTFLIIVYSFIIYKMLNEKNNNMMIKAENDSLMYSLHQYEDMVDRQRVDNHENKNQLLIIKNMIKKNDKDVVKYIDTIVKDQKEDDEALYTRVMTIPSGGLQGIIYQKMLVMKDEKILFSLDVSRDVRKIELDDFSMEDNYRLCKIVGVLLDNAIEESRKIDDKRIMISLYVDDDKLVIDISNRFEGKVEVDKLDDEGYTTKGDGHGYGLSLVKKILSESDIFENERSVRRDVFKQVVRVKIKNT